MWFQAELWFTAGVNQGVSQIDSKLSGVNWLLVKNSYKSYIKKYGGDPNLDWMNFKVRRRYVKLRRKGFSDEQALTAIQEYVQKKNAGNLNTLRSQKYLRAFDRARKTKNCPFHFPRSSIKTNKFSKCSSDL